jgi:hypothetical protein
MHQRPPYGHGFGGRGTPSDRQTSMPADASRVRSRSRLQVVCKKIYPGRCAAFPQGAPPCTLRCKAPASRWMPIASQAGLGSLGSSLTRCFPLEGPPTTRGHGAASEIECCASEGRQHTGASSRAGAVDEGSGWSCTAFGQHTIAGAHVATTVTSRVPKDGINAGRNHRVGRGTARGGAACRCGSRPRTAASWH